MKITTSILLIAITTAQLSTYINAAETKNSSFIAPPMSKINGGSFILGSDKFDRTGPAKKVNVNTFYMAKYPVTVAEFKLFAEDTNYVPDKKCSDYMDENWMSEQEGGPTGSWNGHRYLQSDYQPVTCITPAIAEQYATWLSKKTSDNYRLPTEEEWEYALKANTNSNYFWGDDLAGTQVCKYANVADQSGEYHASERYGASYVGYLGYNNCDDGEPYISIVGLYRPNPFGLYDMVGNVNQVLSGCYKEDYENSSSDKKCEFFPHRTRTWHLPLEPHFERGRGNEKWGIDANMGFRLVADNDVLSTYPSTEVFKKKLFKAQQTRLATRPILPKAPSDIIATPVQGNKIKLSWSKVNDKRVLGYQVYQSVKPYADKLNGYFKNHYRKIKTVAANQIVLDREKASDSYRVVTLIEGLSSLPSKAISLDQPQLLTVPGKLFVQYAHSDDKNILRKSKQNNDPEPYYISKLIKGWELPSTELTFQIDVNETGYYRLNYRGRNVTKGEFFKVWSGNKLLTKAYYDPERDDKTSNKHQVYLEKGAQELNITVKQQGWGRWSLTWLKLEKIDSN